MPIPETHAYLARVAPRNGREPLGFTLDAFRTPSGALRVYAGRADNARFGDGLVEAHKSIPGQPRAGFPSINEAQAWVSDWPRSALAYLAEQATTRLPVSRHVACLDIPPKEARTP